MCFFSKKDASVGKCTLKVSYFLTFCETVVLPKCLPCSLLRHALIAYPAFILSGLEPSRFKLTWCPKSIGLAVRCRSLFPPADVCPDSALQINNTMPNSILPLITLYLLELYSCITCKLIASQMHHNNKAHSRWPVDIWVFIVADIVAIFFQLPNVNGINSC